MFETSMISSHLFLIARWSNLPLLNQVSLFKWWMLKILFWSFLCRELIKWKLNTLFSPVPREMIRFTGALLSQCDSDKSDRIAWGPILHMYCAHSSAFTVQCGQIFPIFVARPVFSQPLRVDTCLCLVCSGPGQTAEWSRFLSKSQSLDGATHEQGSSASTVSPIAGKEWMYLRCLQHI